MQHPGGAPDICSQEDTLESVGLSDKTVVVHKEVEENKQKRKNFTIAAIRR
jgi:hypothetical protein